MAAPSFDLTPSIPTLLARAESLKLNNYHLDNKMPSSWTQVAAKNISDAPCQRSLHAAAVHGNSMYIFGGYDGSNRVNDFYEFNFNEMYWCSIVSFGIPPSPRDRHVALVYKDSFYVFAGFDGSNRVNDFHQYNFETRTWSLVDVMQGTPPNPRHSHAAVIYENSLFCFGGYDGSYKNDFHEFNFETQSWNEINSIGRLPCARYRASCVVYGSKMYLFGGHDGIKHLNDVHRFDFETRTWSSMSVEGISPTPRDSHVAVAYSNKMYVFGGSSGNAMNDFYQLNLETHVWSSVEINGCLPGTRFCHVGCIYKNSFYIFGGYNGSRRLDDFQEFQFIETKSCEIPPSSLIFDLRHLVNHHLYSDVVFLVEGKRIYAHKILCMRCDYFRAMFTGQMQESRAETIELTDLRWPIFLAFLEYLYTDEVLVFPDTVMELFVAADRFGVDRLSKICEAKLLAEMSIENSAAVFHAADLHHATSLRSKCLEFMLNNFDAVTKTLGFEEMGRTNVELVFEILKRR